MDKSFEYNGLFWVAGSPEQGYGGKLTYHSQAGLCLELFIEEALQTGEEGILSATDPIPQNALLHGSLIGEGGVTIYQFSQKKYRYLTSAQEFKVGKRLKVLELVPELVLLGAQIESVEQMLLRSLYYTPTHLESWCEIFTYALDPHGRREQFSLHFRTEQSGIEAWVEPLKARVALRAQPLLEIASQPKKPGDTADVVLNHRDFFEIMPEAPQNLVWFLEAVHQLKNLFMFCFGKRVYTRELAALTPDEDYLKIYFQQSHEQFSPHELAPSKNPIVNFSHFSQYFETIINTYFERFTGHYQPIFEMFISDLYFPATKLTNRFLNICQALEGYHQRKFKQRYLMDPKLYQTQVAPVREALLPLKSVLPEKVYKILEFNIGKGYRITFEQRLEDLIHEIPAELIGIEDAAYFTQMVKRTRNHYTHFNQEKKKFAPEEILKITLQLRYILVLHFLEDLGLKLPEVLSGIEATQDYRLMLGA